MSAEVSFIGISGEALFGLHALVRVSLGVIANDWQLVILSLEAIDQQDDVANQANNANSNSDQACKQAQARNTESTNKTENNSYYCQTPKEEDRLHCVETHKTILLLHQEKDEACHPAQYITQSCFNVGLHTHRGRT